MSKTPISKSQKRALEVLNLTVPDGYAEAAETLSAAGYERDGIPAGKTWRTAAKLSDTELLTDLRHEEIEGPISTINLIEYGY